MPSMDDNGPEEPVIRRLNALRRLSETGVAAIRAALRDKVLKAVAGEDLVNEGDKCDRVRIFLSGLACRYKALEDGRRQIVAFVLPGDTCDVHIYLLSSMDHSIATLTPTTYAEFDRAAFERLMSTDDSVAD